MTNDPQKAMPDRQAHARLSVGMHGEHVLIVDACVERAADLVGSLDDVGLRVTAVHDEAGLANLMRRRTPDLVILNARPGDDSWVATSRHLAPSAHVKIPVLLIADAQDLDWERALDDLAIGRLDSISDFIAPPIDHNLLLAKVRTMLRVGKLQHELRIANTMLKELTLYLDNMVEAKVAELENVNRLRRFFSPQIVEAIVSEDADDLLREHRSEITVVFLDLRKFTAFAERHSPQEVLQLVREFHETVGPIIFRYGGTLERFTGDGLMVFLGDPKPMPDHPYQAVRMALHIQYMIGTKRPKWIKAGYALGLGIGISTGEATLGTIGFERRVDYAAIGTVTNLAARLCGQAASNQTLISEDTYERVRGRIDAVNEGRLRLKGFSKPTLVYSVKGLLADTPTGGDADQSV